MKTKMNSSMDNNVILIISLSVSLLIISHSSLLHAFSCHWGHELGVYSLYEYGLYDGQRWKSTVTPDYMDDPAGAFWDIMKSGTTCNYAHSASRCRINSQVNYHTIFPIPGDGWKDWDQFDLVFFYGHNNMIVPPHSHDSYGTFWSNNPSGDWHKVTGLWSDWGTPSLPYEYFYYDVTTGQEKPGSVTYLYEPFTSLLLGYQFRPNRLSVYQISAQDYSWGNYLSNLGTFRSGLGTKDLEWLILHGCQAVIVANEDGTAYNHMGVKTFRKTWDGFHIILGHYRSYYVSQLKELASFANNLLSGMPIQKAYFLTDPDGNTSAISTERRPCFLFYLIC